MQNKFLLTTVLAIVVITCGYVIYTNFTNQGNQNTLPIKTEVSFICEGGPSFIASFTADMNSLDIIENGTITRSLKINDIETNIMNFADQEMRYEFSGEQVRVSNLQSHDSYLCNQPFDPNNTPFNFGDNEFADDSAALISITSNNLEGLWHSLDDNRSFREFRSDGSFIDSYEGTGDSRGIWRVFTKDNAPDHINFQPEANAVYLLLTDDITPELVLTFKIIKLDSNELELTYLDRGGILRYELIN